MIPEIDREIGMLQYSTSFEGVGGEIRRSDDDFLVSEILDDAALSRINEKDGYAVYSLEKRGIDTSHALAEIYSRIRFRLKPLGLKDARAVTRQYVSAMRRSDYPESFLGRRLALMRVGFAKKPLSKKSMAGNKFSIKVSGYRGSLSSFSEFDGILNYFGYQRFGSRRPVSHLVGRDLVKGDFGGAISHVLSFTSKYDSAERNRTRAGLASISDYARAADAIPAGMDLERTLLRGLASHEDPKAAFACLPLEMRRFFVRAYQSYIFNLTLSALYSDGAQFEPRDGDVCFDEKRDLGRYDGRDTQRLAVPLVGYAYYKKTRFDEPISRILESEGVAPKDFLTREMQEIGAEGGFRMAAIHCKDVIIDGDWVHFSLSRGSFATVVMREILKPAEPLSSGF